MSPSAPAPGGAVEALRVERRGGLAGLRLSADHDYSDLTAGQRQALDRLLSGTADVATTAPGSDRFRYRIQVRHAGGGERLLEVSEDAMPPALAPLVKPGRPG